MALRSPKTSQSPPRKRGKGWVAARWVLVMVILTAAGALIAVGIVEGKGVKYQAGIDVRSATADATCVYFSCPQPVSTTQGNPYVLDQVNAILSPALAAQVAHNLSGVTVTTSQLLSNVCAKEVGQSATIHICYTSPSSADAKNIVDTYAKQYVAWSNARASTSLTNLSNAMKLQLSSLPAPQRAGARGQALAQQIDAVGQALAAFNRSDGPNGAKIFGNDQKGAQVQVTRASTSPVKAGAIGAAAGLVLAIGLLLILPPLIRRPGSDDGGPASDAGSEDSLDLFTAPVDEPVR